MWPLNLNFADRMLALLIGAYIAEKKGRSHYEGFFLGFLFGLLGVIAEIFLPKKPKEN